MASDRKPYTALLLGLLVPGLGHGYAGDKRRAGLAFGVVTTMFVVGYLLADYRVFAFTSSLFAGIPLLELLPIHLLPEAGNFGETMIAWLVQPASDAARDRLMRLPLATEHIGLALTGLSGYLNAILAADASWIVARGRLEAERSRSFPGSPGLSCFLSWVLPGAGHVREGRKVTGLLVGGSILGLWALGLWFSDFTGCDRPQLYWWWAAEAGAGGPTLVSSILLGPLPMDHEMPHMDLGVTLLSLAGLLNIVSLTDVYTLAESNALAAGGVDVTSALPGKS
ncbi:MAG: hypothetical protein H6834_00990 [Planctomycetes bacterium]|nr:hypothetical protein [Planctomycetota bacterium]